MGAVRIRPLVADYAFPNTMKGQRGQIGAGGHCFHTGETEYYSRLYKVYFNWNELERTAEDGEDFIRQVCDIRFADCREHNVRIIPRVALQWPNHGDHTKASSVVGCFPPDMVASTLDTPAFFDRVRNLVMKLGHVWNDDPRIAYVETGIYGLWGEEHEDSLSKTAQRHFARAFLEAFPDKKCMVRCPRDCMGAGFGMYWDSFAHIDEEIYARDCVRFQNWRIAVMGGEVAHNWGRHVLQPGDDMNDTLTDPAHLERFLEYVSWQHNNHLGMWLAADERLEQARCGLAEYQKRAGYRFVPELVEWELTGGFLRVSLQVRNVGSSPFYYRWPLSAALLDESRIPLRIWDFPETDIRRWMPGDEWDFGLHRYRVAPELYSETACFDLSGLSEGRYTLALAIRDPQCGKPSVLFATRQYFTGGWFPAGCVTLGAEERQPLIPEALFDDQRTDCTITY